MWTISLLYKGGLLFCIQPKHRLILSSPICANWNWVTNGTQSSRKHHYLVSQIVGRVTPNVLSKNHPAVRLQQKANLMKYHYCNIWLGIAIQHYPHSCWIYTMSDHGRHTLYCEHFCEHFWAHKYFRQIFNKLAWKLDTETSAQSSLLSSGVQQHAFYFQIIYLMAFYSLC